MTALREVLEETKAALKEIVQADTLVVPRKDMFGKDDTRYVRGPSAIIAKDALTRLTEFAAGDGWKKIESAPRDSSKILVAYLNSNFGEWRVLEAWWRLPYEDAPPKQCWWCYDRDSTLLDKSVHGMGATHWQHLPSPPQGDAP